MTEQVANRRHLYTGYINMALLIFVAGLIITIYTKSTDNGYKTFDTVEDKVKTKILVDMIPNTKEGIDSMIEHVEDTTVHVTDHEVYLMREKMKAQDSIANIFMVEQWKQGRQLARQGKQLKRIETSINELKSQLP